ncbi:MAG: acyltransferase, partial [Bradyrhizobium sp.]|nr:acyltransferase [Bradyrhizobium sp.]
MSMAIGRAAVRAGAGSGARARAPSAGAARFDALDGLRGLAAFLVMTRHTRPFWGFGLFRTYLAVDLFFVLSGFVIANAYDARLASGEMDPGAFVAARLARLYPMFALSLVVATGWRLSTTGFAASGAAYGTFRLFLTAAASAVFVPFPMHVDPTLAPKLYDPFSLFYLNGPYWSLCFELLVNVAYAQWHGRLGERTLRTAVAVSFAVAVACCFAVGKMDFGFFWNLTGAAGLARAAAGFLAGVWLFRHRDDPGPASV